MKKKKLRKKIAKLDEEVAALSHDLMLSERLNKDQRDFIRSLRRPRFRYTCDRCGCLVAEASLSSTKKTGGCKRCKKTVPVAKKVL
mgnify:CR=1 FL=1